MVYSRTPSLGLVLYLLKNSTADFFRFHQSHRQSLGKLQSLDQLPPEELKEVIMDQYTPWLTLITLLYTWGQMVNLSKWRHLKGNQKYGFKITILYLMPSILFPPALTCGLTSDMFSVVVPRPGVRPRRG